MRKHGALWGIALLLASAVLFACDQPGAPPTAVPGAVLLTFERLGGIAGFEDRLVIAAGGEYHLSPPGGGQPERLGTLEAQRRTQLQAWAGRFAAFTLTLEDNPNGPDNMKRRLVWAGAGKTAPSEAEQQAVLDWAASLLDELAAPKK